MDQLVNTMAERATGEAVVLRELTINIKCLGTRKSDGPVKRAEDTQETLERIEHLLAESKRSQRQHAALSKKLKELIRTTEEH